MRMLASFSSASPGMGLYIPPRSSSSSASCSVDVRAIIAPTKPATRATLSVVGGSSPHLSPRIPSPPVVCLRAGLHDEPLPLPPPLPLKADAPGAAGGGGRGKEGRDAASQPPGRSSLRAAAGASDGHARTVGAASAAVERSAAAEAGGGAAGAQDAVSRLGVASCCQLRSVASRLAAGCSTGTRSPRGE